MLLNLLSIYLFISIIVTTFFAAFVQSRSKADYVVVAVLLCLAIDIYLFGYAAELNSSTLKQKLFWNSFQYFGIPFVSALWLSISITYTSRLRLSKCLKFALIYAIPLLTIVFRLTNNWHHLYFASIDMQQAGSFSFLHKQYGVWLYVQGAHSLLMVIAALAIYLDTFIRHARHERENSLFMLGHRCSPFSVWL